MNIALWAEALPTSDALGSADQSIYEGREYAES